MISLCITDLVTWEDGWFAVGKSRLYKLCECLTGFAKLTIYFVWSFNFMENFIFFLDATYFMLNADSFGNYLPCNFNGCVF